MSEPEPIDPNAQTRSLPGFVEVVSETATQPSSRGQPALLASRVPVIGCTTAAVAVKTVSASTTIPATCAISRGSPDRFEITMKNAIPAPVPNSTAAPIT